MQKYEHAFGKNDIRGIYGEDITEELFYNISSGYVEWLLMQTKKTPDELKSVYAQMQGFIRRL